MRSPADWARGSEPRRLPQPETAPSLSCSSVQWGDGNWQGGAVFDGVSNNGLVLFPVSKERPEDGNKHGDTEDAAHGQVADLFSDETARKEYQDNDHEHNRRYAHVGVVVSGPAL